MRRIISNLNENQLQNMKLDVSLSSLLAKNIHRHLEHMHKHLNSQTQPGTLLVHLKTKLSQEGWIKTRKDYPSVKHDKPANYIQ